MKRVRFLFKWYDLWIGAYWDRKKKDLYILPLPMVGVVIKCCRHDWELGRYYTQDNNFREYERCTKCGDEHYADL